MLMKNDKFQRVQTERILEWRESLATLPDNHFFELMRMYLGEIKTPYNKQKLTEELAAFLRRTENRQILVKLLDDTDMQIITAVAMIPDASQERLTAFFSGTYSFASLYERLLNLEERLILFRCRVDGLQKVVIRMNPLLDDVLQPFVDSTRLLPPAVYAERFGSVPCFLSPQLIVSFLAFIAATPDVCKADGEFKKRSAAVLHELFPGKTGNLQLLVTAFINLGLVRENDSGLCVDYQRCAAFAGMDEAAQYAYLCAASCGRFSREGLRSQAQFLLDCAASIPAQGYTRPVLQRLGMLVYTRSSEESCMPPVSPSGRFSQIVERYRTQEPDRENMTAVSGSIVERLIDSAVKFGVFSVSGRTGKGESILTTASRLCGVEVPADSTNVLSIDAGFTVTLMPGLPLSELLPLVRFMTIIHYDSVAEFEIGRKSVVKAFDAGMTPDTIVAQLAAHTQYGVPQNLKISIEEWFRAYNSAALYNGFVLKVDPSNALLSAQNPLLAPHIKVRLAPGIYLLDVTSMEEAAELTGSCGIDFIGRVKTVDRNMPATTFPPLSGGRNSLAQYGESSMQRKTVFESGNSESKAAFFSGMIGRLRDMHLDEELEQGLVSRIRRRIVLNASQLRPDSIRIERNEAGGMDFIGKVRLIERTIAASGMIEMEFGAAGAAGTAPLCILGTPLEIEKQAGDALVRLRLEPERNEKTFSIGQASLVKRIRGSIFEEKPEKNKVGI